MVKIAICGAGIAGLSTYLLLQKHLNDPASPSGEHEIIIYEAYDVQEPIAKNIDEHPSTDSESTPTPQTIGGGIGISKNGLNVLSRMESTTAVDQSMTPSAEGNGSTGLNSGLIKEMARRGHPIERWEISTARGWTIADVNLIPRDLRESSTSGARKKPFMYHSVMISRKACWEILRDRVLEACPKAVVKKRVVHVSIGDATAPNIIKFEDGTEDSVDLIIGADGLRSIVRKVMFEVDNRESRAVDVYEGRQADQSWAQAVFRWIGLSSPSKANDVNKSSGPDYVTPHYEGLVGVGGFVPSSLLESTGHKPGTMSIVFGPNGFFGYGYLTSAEPQDPTANRATGSAKPNNITDSNTNTNPNPNLGPSSSISRTSRPGPVAGWWSTFSSKTPYPYPTTNTSTTLSKTPTSTGPSSKPNDFFNKPLAVTSLLARHKKWKNPTISAIVNYVESCETTNTTTNTITTATTSTSPPHLLTPTPSVPPTVALEASYPTWTTPELPHWTLRGRAVLVGDAAHALQPSSGQGACQALEDAEALALLLGWHLQSIRRGDGKVSTSTSPASPPSTLASALAKALKQYETLRKPRVHAIYERSQKMSRMKGDMGFVMEWTMYLMIYLMSWFHDDFNDALFEYDLPAEVEEVISRDAITRKRNEGSGI